MNARRSRSGIPLLFFLFTAAPFAAMLLSFGCAAYRPQQYSSFTTRTPVPSDSWLVIGILGGWEHWDDDVRTVRRLALDLRAQNLPGVYIETVENKQRHLALQLIERALHHTGDGGMDGAERASAHIILYGQSFGGASVVKLARELNQRHVPVALTVQVDSVGKDDGYVPPNVARAVNFYQRNAFLIEGHAIRAEDPTKTTILGNFRVNMDEETSDVPHKGITPLERFFSGAHVKLAYDSEVWQKVKGYILAEIHSAPPASDARQP